MIDAPETGGGMSAGGIIAGIGSVAGALIQKNANKKAADQQWRRDKAMMNYMNAYNSPESQMSRLQAAGLNANLMYGQGSMGNMSSAPKAPQTQTADFQAVASNLMSQYQQSRLMAAQTDLTKVKTDESGTKQDLMKAQRDLVNANPNLNKSYVSAMVTQLESAAKLKAQEADFMLSMTSPGSQAMEGGRWQRGFLKMQNELNLLEQRFDLGKADKAIKGKVLESKEFQNALQEIQVKWMKDQEITPQHIYQGIMLLLSKMM